MAILASLGACKGSEPIASARGASPSLQTAATHTAASVPAAAAERRPAAAEAPPRLDPPSPSPTDDETRRLLIELRQLIGSASCSDDSQCRALAIGAKACGGPESYVAWSTVGTDAARLQALAHQYRDARQARNQRLGLISDCAVVPQPEVRCLAVPGGTAGRQCRTVPTLGPAQPLER